MTSLITSRRSLLLGLGTTLIASPAIVRASSLMQVKATPKYVIGIDMGSGEYISEATFAHIDGVWKCIKSRNIIFNADGTMSGLLKARE